MERSLARASASRRTWREVAAVGWLVLVAAAFLAPALVHGKSLGPYDVLSQFGLTNNPHVAVHNLVNSDEIEEFIPWQALAWLQVHAGHLPIWNPHSLLGLPFAFNFQSTPFGPTVAIGYLFPLSLAHTATVAARLIIAGSGVYFFARLLRLDVVPALVCATIFELSGGFSVWLGDYPAGCMAWSGWVLASSALVLRGRHRVASSALLAVTLTFAFLEGEPQIGAILVGVVAIFVSVMGVFLWRAGSHRAARSALMDHGVALVAALGMVAPIYLPGIQLALASTRNVGPPISGLPLVDLSHLLFSDYNGLPTSLATVIGPNNLYVSMLYVGSIGLVLALTALSQWRQRREVVAFSLTAVVLLVLLFFSPLLPILRHVPVLGVFRLALATPAIELCLAVLAGFGAQALLTRRGQRPVEWWFLAGIGLVTACLLVLGARLLFHLDHLSAAQTSLRRGSFLWPSIGLVTCLGVLLTRWRRGGRSARHARSRSLTRPGRPWPVGHLELAVLLLVETAFLWSAGSGFVSSSPGFLPTSTAITTLQRLVGSSLLGFGSCEPNAFPPAGLVPDVNLAYQLNEFVAYDPILPRAYHVSYARATNTSAQVSPPFGLFCPQITSLALARHYGVSFVIEPPGTPGPAGTRRVAVLRGEGLYAVPRSGRATLVSRSGTGPSVVQPSSQPTPSTWRIEVNAPRASLLELRISNVPGWQAQIDGRPLALEPFDSVMLEAQVPSGRHVVTLRYWPRAFSAGLAVAGATILSLAGALVLGPLRRRRRGPRVGPASPR